MTVNTTPVETNYTGNASATAFALTFAFAANAHVKVYLAGALQNSGYSITGAGNPSGGTLTFSAAPGNGVAIKARRVTPLTQDIDVVNNATVFASSLETGLDYALMRQQEEAFDRIALGQAFAGGTGSSTRAQNLFPNVEWQLMNGIGPGWDGDPGTLAAHLAAFDTEQNWLYTGNLPAVNVSNIAVAADGSSGQRTITATCDDVQYCYPGQLIIFGASGAHASLLVSAMRIRTVNYNTQTITFQAPRNGNPTAGAVSCSFRPVMRADMAGVTGNGPDHWTKTAGAHLWLDRYPRSTTGMTGTPGWTTNLLPSNKRILVFRPASDADAHFYHIFPDPVSLRGQTITFGFRVNRVSNGTATPFVGGTTYVEGTQVVSTGGWTWLEMTYTVPDNCTELQCGVVFKGSGSDPWRIVDPMAVFGTGIGSNGYRPGERGVVERFIVKQTPDSFHGADFSFGSTGSVAVGFGFKVDVFAETTGAIAEDVCMVMGQLEGSTAVSGATPRAIATRNTFEAPQRYGHVCHAHVNGRPTGDSGEFDIHRADGTFWLYTNVSGAAWDDVSIDMNSAILRL